MKEIMIPGEEVRTYEVKKFGQSGAHIIVPHAAIGMRVSVVFPDALIK